MSEENLNQENQEELNSAVIQDKEQLLPLIEALVFAHGEPIPFEKIKIACSNFSDEDLKEAISNLQAKYSTIEFGIELVLVAGKYQFRTKKTWAEHLRALKEAKPRRLSLQALETLAVIAYRQPVVKSDIEKIRGVDPTPTLKTLLDRQLIRIVGHQDAVGQPALFGTSEEFLKIFGLNSLAELPSLRELKELEEDPGEVDSDEIGEISDSELLKEAAQLDEQINAVQNA
ncbi:MAG: SMC-Scp complex subunit ScpB [Bdellovibrionales bacterium]|nr:SMC-Scp complex subunit ScpB [Bdellovibrionales bacterium]